jgi:hypothetical protein
MSSRHGASQLANLETEFDRGPRNKWFRRAEGADRDTSPSDSDNTGFSTLFELEEHESYFHVFGEHFRRQNGTRDIAKQYEILAKLALTLRPTLGASPIAPEQPEEKPTLPAGYTYLGQLIAHDVSFSSDKTAFVDGPASGNVDRRNLRDVALILQTIYGDGPDAFPLGYVSEAPMLGRGHMDRTRLRLGPLHKSDSDVEPAKWHDLPRTSCPHLREPFGAIASFPRAARVDAVLKRIIDEAKKPDANKDVIARLVADQFPRSLPQTDALVADVRNDQHAIIAQLAALFHRFHNRVCDLFAASAPANGQRQDRDTFAAARSITIHTYRRIILYDFLTKLLDERIYGLYRPEESDQRVVRFLCPRADRSVPVEFSHAAFRFGHAMIRDEYKFSSNVRAFTVQEVLERSSSQVFDFLPSAANWSIEWRKFFDGFKQPGAAALLRSREISPSTVILPFQMDQVLPDNDLFLNDSGSSSEVASLLRQANGLPLRDLIRSCSAPMATVDAIIKRMRRDERLAEVIDAEPLLKSADNRAEAIKDWLRAKNADLSGADLDFVSFNPPLLFFVLFEAQHIGHGIKLGPVGSFIVAEVLCSTLSTPLSPESQEDSRFQVQSYRHRRAWADRYADVFPPDGKLPQTMSELIEFVEAGGD